jgi:indoleamine 2,3-dioxygenase
MPLSTLKRAFLPESEPLLRLPPEYRAWDELALEVPALLAAGQARRILSALPRLDTRGLATVPMRERALGLLSVFGHAAVHESWRRGSTPSVPRNIAIPWMAAAKSLDRLPVLTYASHGLNNWRLLERDGPTALGNLATLRGFYGGLDENWFVAVHVEIEARAAPLVAAVVAAQDAVAVDRAGDLQSALSTVAEVLNGMLHTLKRVRENCDPDIFFNRVQPFMQGMRDVVYEGVDELAAKPQRFAGGSGAQSALLPLLDAALGIRHAGDALIVYLQELRRYMPREHQAFLGDVEQGPAIRDYVAANADRELVDGYNRCIDAVGRFRAEHLDISVDYIQRPAQRQASTRGEHGTGGSPFLGYLKKHREETFAQCLP